MKEQNSPITHAPNNTQKTMTQMHTMQGKKENRIGKKMTAENK